MKKLILVCILLVASLACGQKQNFPSGSSGGGSSAGSSGAAQTSNGSGGFLDGGCTMVSGLLNCPPGAGEGGSFNWPEGTIPTYTNFGSAAYVSCYADSTSHTPKCKLNGGSLVNILTSAGLAAIASGKTLTVSGSMTQTVTDGSTVAFGAGGTVAYGANIQNQSFSYLADSGAADAYVITLVPAVSVYAAGQRFSFKASAANATTTPTLNVNGLGAKTITKNGGAAMAANDIKTGQIVDVEYDGTDMQMQSTLGNAAAGGSVTSRDNLTGTSTLDFVPGDPTVVWAHDDFLGGVNGSGTIGSLGWSPSGVGNTVSNPTGVWPNLGIWRCATGASSGNNCFFSNSAAIGAFGALGSNTNKFWEAYFVFRFNQTTNTSQYVGFAKMDSSPVGNGFGIRFDTNDSDATNFYFYSRTGIGTITKVSTGVAIDTNFHTLRIYSDGATAGKVYLDLDAGAATTTICSGCTINVAPTTDIQDAVFSIVTRTTGAASVDADFFGFKARVSTNAGKRQ